MKKLIAVVCAVILTFMLFGCGASQSAIDEAYKRGYEAGLSDGMEEMRDQISMNELYDLVGAAMQGIDYGMTPMDEPFEWYEHQAAEDYEWAYECLEIAYGYLIDALDLIEACM